MTDPIQISHPALAALLHGYDFDGDGKFDAFEINKAKLGVDRELRKCQKEGWLNPIADTYDNAAKNAYLKELAKLSNVLTNSTNDFFYFTPVEFSVVDGSLAQKVNQKLQNLTDDVDAVLAENVKAYSTADKARAVSIVRRLICAVIDAPRVAATLSDVDALVDSDEEVHVYFEVESYQHTHYAFSESSKQYLYLLLNTIQADPQLYIDGLREQELSETESVSIGTTIGRLLGKWNLADAFKE